MLWSAGGFAVRLDKPHAALNILRDFMLFHRTHKDVSSYFLRTCTMETDLPEFTVVINNTEVLGKDQE